MVAALQPTMSPDVARLAHAFESIPTRDEAGVPVLDVAAIVAHLRSVPPVKNAAREAPPSAATITGRFLQAPPP